jgi:hypothetical protein
VKRHPLLWVIPPLTLALIGMTLVILHGTHILLNEKPADQKHPPITWAQFDSLKLGEPASVIAKFIPEVGRDKDSSGDTVIPSSDGQGYFWLEWDNRIMPGYDSAASCLDECPTGDFLHKKAYYPKEGPSGPQGQGTGVPG